MKKRDSSKKRWTWRSAEVTALVGPTNQANPKRGNVRQGSQAGYCVLGERKIPLERPRMRNLDKKSC